MPCAKKRTVFMLLFRAVSNRSSSGSRLTLPTTPEPTWRAVTPVRPSASCKGRRRDARAAHGMAGASRAAPVSQRALERNIGRGAILPP